MRRRILAIIRCIVECNCLTQYFTVQWKEILIIKKDDQYFKKSCESDWKSCGEKSSIICIFIYIKCEFLSFFISHKTSCTTHGKLRRKSSSASSSFFSFPFSSFCIVFCPSFPFSFSTSTTVSLRKYLQSYVARYHADAFFFCSCLTSCPTYILVLTPFFFRDLVPPF